MGTIASEITSLTIVYTAVYSDADQSKHQSSASLAFVWGIHRDRWIPRTKGQLRGKSVHLMTSSWSYTEEVITNKMKDSVQLTLIKGQISSFRLWYIRYVLSQLWDIHYTLSMHDEIYISWKNNAVNVSNHKDFFLTPQMFNVFSLSLSFMERLDVKFRSSKEMNF